MGLVHVRRWALDWGNTIAGVTTGATAILPSRRWAALACVAAALLGIPPLWAASDTAARAAAAERALTEMRTAFHKGEASRLASLLPQVQGHPLEPLAAYWALRA
ncbi:MAG: hypothetical protein ACK4TH_12560, partial [Tepidimonas sp.]